MSAWSHTEALLTCGFWCSHCRRPFINRQTGRYFKRVEPWRLKKGIAFCNRVCATRFSADLARILKKEAV